jgi:hypothetical protein
MVPSFRRKPESSARSTIKKNWIPAFAGMTSEWQPLTFPTTIRKPTGAALI